MLKNFDDFRWGGPLSNMYGYVQNCTINATGGTSGKPSARTTALNDGDFGNGFYDGSPSQHRTGIVCVRSNFTVADTGQWGVIEVWQGDRCVALKPSGSALQVWTVNEGTIYTIADAIGSGFTKVELKFTVSSLNEINELNSDGSIAVRVDDTQVYTTSGRTIGYPEVPGAIRDVFWNVVVVNPHGDCDLYYLCDGSGSRNNDFLGSGVEVFYARAVSGNGSYAEMTPSTGTDHGALVDEDVDDGDTTYLSVTGQARKSTFNYQDFASIGDKIVLGVKHTASGKKTDSGYRRFRSVMVRDDADRFATRDWPIGVGYFNWMQHVWELDPYTNSRFTVDNINASEFGCVTG